MSFLRRLVDVEVDVEVVVEVVVEVDAEVDAEIDAERVRRVRCRDEVGIVNEYQSR